MGRTILEETDRWKDERVFNELGENRTKSYGVDGLTRSSREASYIVSGVNKLADGPPNLADFMEKDLLEAC